MANVWEENGPVVTCKGATKKAKLHCYIVYAMMLYSFNTEPEETAIFGIATMSRLVVLILAASMMVRLVLRARKKEMEMLKRIQRDGGVQSSYF